jgi:GDP-4-dehydro-6-deoxy-D-mannose reductase
VYGAPEGVSAPFPETAACRPLDPYAVSKRAAEDIGRVAGERHGITVVVARLFNLIGPGLQERHLCAALARQVALIEAGLAAPTIRVGPLNATRDFVDVRDAARALLVLGEAEAPAEVYNVGSGVERPAEEALAALLDCAGLAETVAIDRQPGRRADAPRLVGDTTRLEGLGFAPVLPFRESLADMLDYYRALER